MKKVPFVAFGNDELAKHPVVGEGDKIRCPRCKKWHPLECGTSDGKKSNTLMFYKCKGVVYLGAVAGRDVTKTFKV